MHTPEIGSDAALLHVRPDAVRHDSASAESSSLDSAWGAIVGGAYIHILLEPYGYRWYRVGGLVYLLKRSEV